MTPGSGAYGAWTTIPYASSFTAVYPYQIQSASKIQAQALNADRQTSQTQSTTAYYDAAGPQISLAQIGTPAAPGMVSVQGTVSDPESGLDAATVTVQYSPAGQNTWQRPRAIRPPTAASTDAPGAPRSFPQAATTCG